MVVGQKQSPRETRFREMKNMWVNEVAPERLAELFHHYHQALMPEISVKAAKAADRGRKSRNRRRTA
jgi:hypothetical protein